jgi:hypothetical protein
MSLRQELSQQLCMGGLSLSPSLFKDSGAITNCQEFVDGFIEMRLRYYFS